MLRILPSTALAAIVTALCTPLPAVAQAVDYAALGDMMGEPVTTSVTGKPQRASEAPASITIITHEQIARSPARDIPGLLKGYAGIDVNSWTAGQSDVAVRGSIQVYNPRLLVMVNGRQVYLDHYGVTNWNLLGVQLDEIQQIELVRGPSSALFGFNATSGAVNIITVDAMTNRIRASAEIGNHGISRISAVAGLALGDNAGFRLSAGRSREHPRAVPKTLFDPQLNTASEHDEVSATFTATPGGNNFISVNGGYAHSVGLEFQAAPTVGAAHYKTKTLGATISHDTGWGSLDGHAYVNGLNYRAVSNANLASDILLTNRVIVGQGSVLARLGRATTIRIGGEYRSNRARGASLYSPEISYDVVAANAMLDAHISDRVTVTVATRIDRLRLKQSGTPVQPIIDAPDGFDRRLTPFSFNAAVLVRVGADGQLRFNAGRGIQAPSLLGFGLHIPVPSPGLPFPFVLAGDPRVRPTEIWSAEVGYAQTIASGFELKTSAFVAKTDEFIALSAGAAPILVIGPTGQPVLVLRITNVGDLMTYGAEISLSGKVGLWTGRVNYTWARTDDGALIPGATGDPQIDAKQAMPTHKVNAELSYDPGRWFGTMTGRYTSSTHQLGAIGYSDFLPMKIPATVALDAKFGWRVTPMATLTIAGENLTKARGAAGSTIFADRRLRAGVSVGL